MIAKVRICFLAAVLAALSLVAFYGVPVHANQLLATGSNFGTATTIDSEGNLITVGNSAPFSIGQAQTFLLKYVPELPDSPNGRLSCMRTFGNGGGNEQPLDTFGYAVATDSSNNIYVAGTTQTFGGEDYDVFLQQYDQSCNLIYTQQWGGPGNDIARGIAVDAADNVYITGSTDSFNNGVTQIFLLKYSPWGSFQFSQEWGTQNTYGSGVAADSLGNVYVIGTTTGPKGTDAVLLKYDSSGNLLYVKMLGATLALNRPLNGTINDYGTGVTVDSGGYVYVTGYTYSFGPTPGVSAVYVMKYDQAGNLVWQNIWGGTLNDYATGIAVDVDANVYLTGYTKSYSINPGIPSAFLLKFDQAGNLLFERTWGGNRGDYAYSVAVDTSENAYVTGYTYSFGPNSQGANFFILKYDIWQSSLPEDLRRRYSRPVKPHHVHNPARLSSS